MFRVSIVKPLACLLGSTFAALAFAGITINIDTKDGESISGEKTFKVTVTADHNVTKVEFYVNDDLRGEDESTPYEFKLDTLAEKEGEIKIKFAAYTTEAENASKTLTLKVDNGLGKDADWHLQKGKEALVDSKWDDAISAARAALKIKPGYNPARILMARAYFGKRVYDQAQKFAEDAVAAEPKNGDALELLSAINLQKAFTMFSRSTTDRETTLKNFGTALKDAVKARRTILENELDAFGTVTDANRIQYVDLAIRARRYSLAIDQLTPLFRKDTRKSEIANRLLYAQLRAARMKDAYFTMGEYVKGNQMDGYGNALVAILYLQTGEREKAQDAEKEALLNDPESLGVRTAQAYLALKRGSTDALNKIATQLSQSEGQRADILYYLATVNYLLGNLDRAADYFQECVLADPTNYDMYIQRANEAISVSRRLGDGQTDEKKYQAAVARAFFDAALEAKPDSFEALTGLALMNLLDGKVADGLRFAEAATKAGPEYAAAHYALAAAYGLSNRETDGLKAMVQAGKWDKPELEGMSIPSALKAWQYYFRHGRTPLIAAPK